MALVNDNDMCWNIINFFRGAGYSDIAISGIFGSIIVETAHTINPKIVQTSYRKKYGITNDEYTAKVDNGTWKTPDTGLPFTADKIGYGLFQYTSSGRKTNLYNYAKSKNASVGDWQIQCEWAYKEIHSTGYANVRKALDEGTDIEKCALVFMREFERPASKDDPVYQQKRIDYAKQFYAEFFEKENKKMGTPILALSAGHYYYTPGKRCLKSIDPTETREWMLNSRIADMLTDILKGYNVEILRLDDKTGQTSVTLETRASMSDAVNADMYLAIHHNAGINGGSGGGTVVYHYPKDERKASAKRMYDAVVGLTKLKGNRANPLVATKSLYEIYKPKAPAFLLENGFMDSKNDTPIILTELHARKTAEGLANFIIAELKLTKAIAEPEPVEVPAVDSSETLEKIDRIIEELMEIRESLV